MRKLINPFEVKIICKTCNHRERVESRYEVSCDGCGAVLGTVEGSIKASFSSGSHSIHLDAFMNRNEDDDVEPLDFCSVKCFVKYIRENAFDNKKVDFIPINFDGKEEVLEFIKFLK